MSRAACAIGKTIRAAVSSSVVLYLNAPCLIHTRAAPLATSRAGCVVASARCGDQMRSERGPSRSRPLLVVRQLLCRPAAADDSLPVPGGAWLDFGAHVHIGPVLNNVISSVL